MTGSKRANRDAVDGDALGRRHLADACEQGALGLGQHVVVGVAQVDGDLGSGGHHVDEVGVQLDAAHRADQALDGGGQLAHGDHGPGGHQTGVVAQVHGRGARVVGLARERELVPRDPLDPGDDADRGALGLEHGTLLDVQLDEGVRRPGRARQRADVADAVELVAEHGAVDGHRVERHLEGQAAGEHEAAQHVGREAGALLVGEEGHGQRMGGLDPRADHGLEHLEAGEHAEVAVVAAAGGHGVDVRAGHDGRLEAIARPGAEHVADAVDLDAQAEVAHPRDHEVAAGAVGRGEGEPAHAAAVDGADLAERGESGQQAGPVDP